MDLSELAQPGCYFGPFDDDSLLSASTAQADTELSPRYIIDVVLETRVLVSRRLEDKKMKVLVLDHEVLVLNI